jgi:meiotically up-regulated gene 157 (Mug157) protein
MKRRIRSNSRPEPENRKFVSKVVEDTILEVLSVTRDDEIAWMFENCFPNTLDTTVEYRESDGKPDTFVITGDIPAMWLRDSAAQVWPYLQLLSEDEALKRLVAGVIRRHSDCIRIDPYANAFLKDYSEQSFWSSDDPRPVPGVHERKWEIDSLCYPIRLAYEYFRITKETAPFDDDWDAAMRLVVATFKSERRLDGRTPYRFIRRTTSVVDTAPFEGTGRPAKPVGLICSAFRPSDDSTVLPFLVPSNLFAIVSLRNLATIYRDGREDAAFALECEDLADSVEASVEKHAIVTHPAHGEIYAYEVDGYGSALLMDDANVPSLLSLPYIGAVSSHDKTYKNTRQFLLSQSNPYFFVGAAASGQGSPHTGKRSIWPMATIIRAITSSDRDEIVACLKSLKATHASTGYMHESFDKDDPGIYTREWFAWTNTLFGELILGIYRDDPDILQIQL